MRAAEDPDSTIRLRYQIAQSDDTIRSRDLIAQPASASAELPKVITVAAA